MSALENVSIPMELAGRTDAVSRSLEMLEAVGLGHRLSHYPSQLSGGEQQRVALARAFVVQPKLILADEPTGNLDGATGAKVIDQMFRLCSDNGTTLLLITHDLSLAENCRRCVTMNDGKIYENSAKSLVSPT